MSTEQKLDQYAELQVERTKVARQEQDLFDSVLTPEIKAKLDDIRAEFEPMLQSLDEKIVGLADQIEAETLAKGDTVKGSLAMAVFNKGRVSWDSKKLEGFLKAHPELEDCRTQGKPYITLRAV